jgi:hypothetical protein
MADPLERIEDELSASYAKDLHDKVAACVNTWLEVQPDLALDWHAIVLGVLVWQVAEKLCPLNAHDDDDVVIEMLMGFVRSAWERQRS